MSRGAGTRLVAWVAIGVLWVIGATCAPAVEARSKVKSAKRRIGILRLRKSR